MTAEAEERGHRHTKSSIQEAYKGISGIEELRPAGVFQVDHRGKPILAARLTNVPEVIKVEKPSAPIKDKNTTYNSQHCKDGYPYHYRQEKPQMADVKLQEISEKVAPGKRHPFEIKSRSA